MKFPGLSWAWRTRLFLGLHVGGLAILSQTLVGHVRGDEHGREGTNMAAATLASASTDGSGKSAGWGNLKGRILVQGDLAPPPKLNTDKDREYCLANGHEIVDETVVVGKDQGLRDVFVMLYLARGEDPPPVHPSFEESKKKSVTLDNAKCRFEPHAAIVRTGQVLKMSNSDQIGHNVHTLNNDEKNKTVPAGGSIEVTYEKADKIPADVECNIHPFMKGVLLVRDDPYAAVTDERGQFAIENIPAGKWKFQFWHKKTGYLSMLQREGKPFLEKRGEFALEIKDGETIDLGNLILAADVLNKRD